jgi:hypothetical protein
MFIHIVKGKPSVSGIAPEEGGGGSIACVSASTFIIGSATSQYGHGKVDEVVNGKIVTWVTFAAFADGPLTGVYCPTATSCIATGGESSHNPGPNSYWISGVVTLKL